MLTALRRLAATWVAKVLFALLILSFGIWGIEDMVRNIGRDNSIARVAGQPIEFEEAQGAARRELARIQRQLPSESSRRNSFSTTAPSEIDGSIVKDRAWRSRSSGWSFSWRNARQPILAIRSDG